MTIETREEAAALVTLQAGAVDRAHGVVLLARQLHTDPDALHDYAVALAKLSRAGRRLADAAAAIAAESLMLEAGWGDDDDEPAPTHPARPTPPTGPHHPKPDPVPAPPRPRRGCSNITGMGAGGYL